MKSEQKSGSAGRQRSDSRDRISRLFLWLDEKLDMLEQRSLAGGEELTLAEHEKDARTMISLIRVYEKLVEMKERLDDRTQGAKGADKGYDAEEAEQRRIEIAQRIERLQRQKEDSRRTARPSR